MSITQESTVAEAALSVTQVAHRIDGALRDLGDGWIEGEIRALTQHRSGHVYLTLADEDSNLEACIWKGRVKRCLPLPKRGDLVQAHYERIDFYAPRGATKLVIDQIKPTGEGELLRRRAETLGRLRADGLCDEDRRKPLPAFPRRVGVIAAQGSDAKVDVIRHLQQRLPTQDIVFAPAAVQGVEAVGSVIDALGILQAIDDVDVIIIARGGGSVADLLAFDDERLCRAIFACAVPVITSIGHTKDRPNCDYVACAFAPVPAKAAEYAIARSATELEEELDRHSHQLHKILASTRGYRDRLADCWRALRPRQRTAGLTQEVLGIGELLNSRARASHHRDELRLLGGGRELELLGANFPRPRMLDDPREQLSGAATQFTSAHLRSIDEDRDGLHRGARRIPPPATLDAPAAHLQSAGTRMRERRRDYSRAFDRLANDGARDVHRRANAETRALHSHSQALPVAAERLLGRARERVTHLSALVAGKDFRRRGWVLATDSQGNGVSSVTDLEVGSALELQFADGQAAARIDRIRTSEQGEQQ
ncbi:MAG TPA: exodeoxyribonuclease VII large subunit [Solirubrobacteraceae bacterium]